VQTETARLRTDREVVTDLCPEFAVLSSMAPYTAELDTAGVSFARAQPFPPQPLFATEWPMQQYLRTHRPSSMA
jgi:hypothetical protein